MDPITTSIVAALAAGLAGGATEVAKKVIVDAYDALKTAITEKFGTDSRIVKAVTELESEPKFKPNQDALAGRVAQVKATDDLELQQLALALIEALESTPEGQESVVKYQIVASDSQIGVIGDDATVEGGIHFGKPGKERSA